MVSNFVWIGIVIGVFFVGTIVSYAVVTSSYDPMTMKFRNQDMFDLVMSHNPKMTQQWMDSGMMQSPQQMEQMNTMMNDPEQRQKMMSMMMQNPDMMQSMMENQQMMQMMDNMRMGNMMMGNMSGQGMMDSGMQGKSMMGSGMTGSLTMSNMPFDLNMPATMPMIDGYYNGEKIFFIHTEVSDKDMAEMMSMMINFPTLHVSELNNISPDEMSKVYVFTNGISGSGPYGGGPFMFQIDVFDSIPDQMGYSQFRVPHLVTWSDNSTPRIMTSVNEILAAESNGELTIQKTDNVVNAPMIVWKSGGMEQTASMIPRMFESMPGVDGQVTNVDVDNYVITLKMHAKGSMGMMNP